MATESGREGRHSRWIDHVIATTPQGCIKRFSRNKSLIDNLGQVFAHLCQTLRVLCNYEHCLHLFVDRSLPEVDVLWPTQDRLAYRHLRYHDQRYRLYQTLQRISKWDERAGKRTDIPQMMHLGAADLAELVGLLQVPATVAEDARGILVPFDFAGLNLGLFVLWGEREKGREQASPDNEQLHGWAAATYYFLKEFFEREYAMLSEETYLPSFYAARWTKAAILFADIKNFTPLTQILRNIYAQPGQRDTAVLREILNKHCREMASIIQQKGEGRIDRFFGPGVMAIFGEHERNPAKAAGNATYVATEMVKRFQTLRVEFLETAFGADYETEYNESVDIQLAIGIDFGTVLFDYLGDENHREYTVIGDHVNSAKQLQYEALRVDASGCRRPPILISPTVERCIRPWMTSRECVLSEEEVSAICTAYGITLGDFDTARFLDCRENSSWESVWAESNLSPPR